MRTSHVAFDRRLLGGLSTDTFLARHWQRKPLLVRRAVDPMPRLPDRPALAALAASDDVEVAARHRRRRPLVDDARPDRPAATTTPRLDAAGAGRQPLRRGGRRADAALLVRVGDASRRPDDQPRGRRRRRRAAPRFVRRVPAAGRRPASLALARRAVDHRARTGAGRRPAGQAAEALRADRRGRARTGRACCTCRRRARTRERPSAPASPRRSAFARRRGTS